LSCGTIAHSGADAILVASDLSYPVLFLEGLRLGVSAVKGKLCKEENILPSIMFNLKAMQNKSEEIYNVLVFGGETKKRFGVGIGWLTWTMLRLCSRRFEVT